MSLNDFQKAIVLGIPEVLPEPKALDDRIPHLHSPHLYVAGSLVLGGGLHP